MSADKPIDVETVPTQSVAVRETAPVDKLAVSGPMTPAQAKIDAVAALTLAAYQRAATLELTPEETAKLQADFPDEAFLPGAAGKEHLIYIEHAHLRDRFNQVFGLGKWAIVPRNRWAEPFTTKAYPGKPPQEGSRVYVEAMLVVRGCFVGEAVGAMEYYPSNAAQNYGDAVEGAKTAAFRRCAKEFGVGLQAWKKEWCEGWWARKRSGQRQNAPGRAASAAPPSDPGPGPNAPQKPASAKDGLKLATNATRKWMIEQLMAGEGEANRDIVTEYFRKCENQLLPNEEIEDLPLRFVPVTKRQMEALSNSIANFEAGGDAVVAFPPNPEAEPKKAASPAAESYGPTTTGKSQTRTTPGSPGKTSETSGEKSSEKSGLDEWFMNLIVPVPRKGQKRDAYLKNPDTIGSLFAARHGQDADSQEARQRLWGFVNHYEAKGWTKKDGTQMPPSASDIKFREALDAFAAWFEKNHPGEKL